MTSSYDAKNRLTQIADTLVGTFGFTYDAIDRRTSLVYPNGITTSYNYDDAYRLTAIVAKNGQKQILDAWSYQYDAAGNRTSKTGLDGKAEVYAYDTTDRLTSAAYTDGTSETFTYDGVGNRQTKSDQNGIVTTSSYDIANELLTAGTDALTYDNNGNMLKKVTASGTTTVTYNGRNLPLTIAAPDGTETNQYGPNGERTYYMNPQAGQYAEYPQYDQSGNPIAEVMGTNYLWSIRIYRVYGPGVDEPLAEWKDNQPINYLHHDALGSVTLATDSNATPLYGRTYSAFGTPSPKVYGSTNYWQTRLGYTSRENAVGGLVGYRSRTYDPAYGRFAEQDSYEGESTSPPSLHRYNYAWQAPLRFLDPYGHSVFAPAVEKLVLAMFLVAILQLVGCLAVTTTSQGLSCMSDTAGYLNSFEVFKSGKLNGASWLFQIANMFGQIVLEGVWGGLGWEGVFWYVLALGSGIIASAAVGEWFVANYPKAVGEFSSSSDKFLVGAAIVDFTWGVNWLIEWAKKSIDKYMALKGETKQPPEM